MKFKCFFLSRSDKKNCSPRGPTRSVKSQRYLDYGINKDKYIQLKIFIQYFNKYRYFEIEFKWGFFSLYGHNMRQATCLKDEVLKFQ